MKYFIKNKEGVTLILTFMIMVAVVAITVAFLFLTNSRMRGTGYDVASHKSLWLAEAGFHDVMYRLRTDAGYRASPGLVSANLGDGSYSVSVTANGNTYTMTSTGTVDVINRQVTQSAVVSSSFPDAFDYAVFGDTNSSRLRLRNTATVSGDLYYDGDVRIDSNASVTNGLVYADDVSGSGIYTEAPGPPDPVPAYPAFDTTYYDNEIATGLAMSPSNFTLSGTDNLDLAGGTVYYRDFTVRDNATVTGPGTIVATDDVNLRNNANISSDVTIIARDDFTVRNNAIVQSGGILYGRDSLRLRNSANVTGSLLVPKNNKVATVQNSATFTGIIYADRVRLRGNAVINGSVVADEYVGNRIPNNVNITYDQGSFPSSVPTGIPSGGYSVTPQSDWDEV